MKDCLRNKVKFVEGLNTAVSGRDNISNISSVKYVVFANVNDDDWTTEFLVVNYVGGAYQARCCSCNSHAAILEELSGMLYSSSHNRQGTNDTQYFNNLLAKTKADYAGDPRYAQKVLTF